MATTDSCYNLIFYGDFMEEIWKDIPAYENLYQISNFGRVRSLDRVVKNHLYKGKIMTPVDNGNGYLTIKLSKNHKYKRFYIHILVAVMFLNFNSNSGFEVNHIDHNKYNNQVDNLEIVTHRDNLKKAVKYYGGFRNRYGFHKIK